MTREEVLDLVRRVRNRAAHPPPPPAPPWRGENMYARDGWRQACDEIKAEIEKRWEEEGEDV